MTSKEKFSVTFKMEAEALELALYGPIGEDFFGAGITDTMVAQTLKSASPYASITLRLNSPGGDLFQGVSICNLLKAQGKPVNVIVDGLAASAASIIAMAGDTVVMQPGSMMMIHEAQGVCMGYSADMTKMAETLDAVSSSAADVYVGKTKMSKRAVMKLMTDETWMEPKQAVELGFATEAGTGKQAKVSNSFDLSVFKNVPEELKPTEVLSDEKKIVVDEKIAEAREAIEALEKAILWEDTGIDIDLRLKRIQLARARG